MVKSITLLIGAFVIVSCATTKPSPGSGAILPSSSLIEQNRVGHWITRPSDGSLIILGVANRQRKSEDEIDSARSDAARKVAMFHRVKGSVTHVNEVGTGNLDWFADTDVNLEIDSDYDKYRDALSFDPTEDVLVIDGAVFVRFKYAGSLPGDLSYVYGRNQDGAPDWVNHPPAEIGGYLVGVGFARPQRRAKDTFLRSCENASLSIISRLSTRIVAGVTDAAGSGSSSFYQMSEGELSGFYVLEMWRDPDTNALWTLSIARPN